MSLALFRAVGCIPENSKPVEAIIKEIEAEDS